MKELIYRYIFMTGLIGLNPTQNSKVAFLYTSILNIALFIILILQTVLIAVKQYDNFINLTFDIILWCGVAQVLMKNFTLYSNRDIITKLIDVNVNKFWTFGSLSPEQSDYIKNIFAYTKFILNLYLALLSIALYGLFVVSYIKGDGNFVMNIWLPESIKETFETWPVHEVFFVFECFLVGVNATFGLIPCDSLYIIFVVTIIAQLKIMNYKLHSLKEAASPEENKKKIVEIIQKHNLYFEYLADLEKIYSTLMLLLLACNMIVTAMNIYAAVINSTVVQKMEYVLICAVAYFQIFIFCFMGQMVQDETQYVANAAYDCIWELIPDKNIRHMLIMIILRAQKQVRVTMGGLLVMDLETFTRVSRAILSFLTLLLNMK